MQPNENHYPGWRFARGLEGYPWYAIRVRSRFERITAAGLAGKGYKPFVPTYRVRRRWSDRVKEQDLPLFPGYVFCRLDVEHRLPILATPGVLCVVAFDRRPVPIDDGEIRAIETMVNSGFRLQPWPYLKIGSKVRIEAGPLTGIEGIVITVKNHDRLVISVTLLQRSVAVEIDSNCVRPMDHGSNLAYSDAIALLRGVG